MTLCGIRVLQRCSQLCRAALMQGVLAPLAAWRSDAGRRLSSILVYRAWGSSQGKPSESDRLSQESQPCLTLACFFGQWENRLAHILQYLQEYLVNGPLGKSGFLAAFSLIFLSEIGDKTFFIAALLAMKVGKWMSYFGSVAALVVMTIISVGIGAVFSRVPDALKSSIPVGELAGIALLVFFGIKALRVRKSSQMHCSSSQQSNCKSMRTNALGSCPLLMYAINESCMQPMCSASACT